MSKKPELPPDQVPTPGPDARAAEAGPAFRPLAASAGRIAYFDCFAGISGDMTLGALLAAGLDEGELRRGLESLGLPGWELRTRRVQRHAITATDVEVIDRAHTPHHEHSGDQEHDSHNPPHTHTHFPPHHHEDAAGQAYEHGAAHDHEHAHVEPHGAVTVHPPHEHGARHEHAHAHEHAHGHSHDHAHDHSHGGEHGHVHGRHLAEILAMIRNSELPEPVKQRASAVFQRLGEAEAKIHDVPVETIHFHEVGAVDSIIDIVGSVLGLHLLGVERIVCSPLPMGHGFVRASHGLMPIPAPATMELLKGVPTRRVDVEGELVTPTGATLMATLADEFGWMPAMRVEAIGYGAGKKEFPFPNLLRICIGTAVG